MLIIAMCVVSQLREALGLKEGDLPPWINKLWIYGYPPGYMSMWSVGCGVDQTMAD